MLSRAQILYVLVVYVFIASSSTFPEMSQFGDSGNQEQLLSNTSQHKRAKCGRIKKGTGKRTFEIDFEKQQDINFFMTNDKEIPGNEKSLSSAYYKNGANSLLWEWPNVQPGPSRPKLTLKLKGKKRKDKEVTDGGFKFWMYRESKSPESTMLITFRGSTRSSPKTEVNLNFKGWRGVWISYREFDEKEFKVRNIKFIDFEITSAEADKLYLDVIQFVKSLTKQTRDLVVMSVGTGDQQVASTFGASSGSQQAEEYNTAKEFWQQSLNWYNKGEPRNVEEITNEKEKLKDIENIEKKIENWYASTDEVLGSLGEMTSNTDIFHEYNFAEAKKKRWDSLLVAISTAHDLYDKIQFDAQRPPLFPIVSDYGKKDIEDGPDATSKFGFVFSDVLRPLALEFNFMSRAAEISYLSSESICNALLQGEASDAYQKALTKIAGKNEAMKTKFKEWISKGNIECTMNTQTSRTSVEMYIEQLNTFRFEKIKKLLLYMEEQGWAEGSGLGTLDHEMNKAGSGFMHSMFLLRKALNAREPELLKRLLGAMKWYNDFNEIYQDDKDYVYDGTTADRMRTILLYRLFIILIDNENSDSQIRNLQYFQTWFKHALKVNKALGGVIKPDFTGFHHKTYYGSAYVPHALHNAALVNYFLQGTSFQLAAVAENNLGKALKLLRAVAVKYSTPNSLCGRFPSYTKAVLLEHFPAYAYMGYSKPRFVSMFLRLLGTNDLKVQTFLEDGDFKSGIYYWNTIGSLDVLKGVGAIKCANNQPCTEENSPRGHWSKNFAALSVHRREDWSVAAKGMSRYSWDYESSGTENVYGVFGSHGSLQISNSEETLGIYDVSNGWDWSRVPGATTIKLEVDNIETSQARNYNYKGRFAGGVAFIGSKGGDPKNGAFGMHFINPDYKMGKALEGTPLDKVNFEFKKSYFFYNNLIVCLGSDIKLSGQYLTSANFAQTTLFQNQMIDSTSTVEVDGNTHSLIATVNQEFTFQHANKPRVTLKDVNNNIYQVETGSNTILVNIGEQTSKSPDGCTETKGSNAVAVLKHTDQTSSYTYAILVTGGNRDMLNKFTVIKQDDEAHAIKLTNVPGLDQQAVVYGYSVFKPFNTAALEGPVKAVSDSCMVMIEKSDNSLHLAISDPTLEFQEDPSMKGKAACTLRERSEKDDDPNRILNPKSSQGVGARLMYCYEGKARDPAISITLNHGIKGITSMKVDGKTVGENSYPKIDSTKTVLAFANLVNGFTTEVQLDLA